jgi:ectoine hydroxylase-related dioxygenase (phytanoyl-CoA dioxygenase family)
MGTELQYRPGLGSHRATATAVPDVPTPQPTPALAPRGAALVWNAALWHGAPAHEGAPRRAVLTLWRRAWLRPQYDLARVVRPAVLARAGPLGRSVFGLD